MQRLFLPIVGLLLVACVTQSDTDRIVLKTHRAGWVWFLDSHQTYVISADGSGEVSASLPPGLVDEPAWSPDREWVVFDTLYKDSARAGGNADIYLMRSDGSQRVRLTDNPFDDLTPSWSPDGTRVAYYSAREAQKSGIYVLYVRCVIHGESCSLDPTYLTKGYQPDWSPDGQRIAYAHYLSAPDQPEQGIYVINADGTGEPMNLVPNLQYCRHPDWSPNGKRIVFSCAGVVYVVNPDGSGLTELIRNSADPSWSPDGRQIAFISNHERSGECVGGFCGTGGIYPDALFLMNADGSNVIRLSKHNDERVLWYSWMPARAKNR